MFSEEFLTELNGIKGIKVYKEMASNDDTVGAILFAIKMLIRNATWTVEPGGSGPNDQEAADFVETCMNDMSSTWTDTISEILSFLTYGWSFHEICYKRRNGKKRDTELSSKYSDGLIGWSKLPIRSQDTLYRWEYDNNDGGEVYTGQITHLPGEKLSGAAAKNGGETNVTGGTPFTMD